MDRLSSEILLSIFKRLTSIEMVNVMTVCRNWLEVIDDNQSLWRQLILPKRENGWKLAVLMLFDQKCQSTLTEVSMEVTELSDQDVDDFCELLEKSKDTLQIIEVNDGYGCLVSRNSASFAEFPNLIKLVYRLSTNRKVELCERYQDEVLTSSGHPKLRILWIAYRVILVNLSLPFIKNLSSLSLEEWCSSSRWKKVLKGPSQTLKHLKMQVFDSNVEDDDDSLVEEETEISSITFPKLKVFEFSCFRRSDEPPQWMDTPSVSVLITNARKNSLLSYSSLSTLWIEDDITYVWELVNNSPLLSELRIGKSTRNPDNGRPLGTLVYLFGILQRRSRGVDANSIVNGFQLRQIRTLVLPASYLNNNENLVKAYISNLRKLVEEVVAFESESRIIKVEI